MNKFYEVTVGVVIGTLKSGKEKITKETYLVNAMSVTEAEARVVKVFTDEGTILDYSVKIAKESRILRVIE